MLTRTKSLSDNMIRSLLGRAYDAAATSTDNSNQNGALLVDSNTLNVLGVGANNFPDKVSFTEDRATTRPTKYRYYEHAERWAIFNAARQGSVVKGSCMICPWAACCDCARAMIVSGVSVLHMHQQRMEMTPDRWKDDVNEALNMLMEAGVFLKYYDGQVYSDVPILVNGELWSPSDDSIVDDGTGTWAIGMEG